MRCIFILQVAFGFIIIAGCDGESWDDEDTFDDDMADDDDTHTPDDDDDDLTEDDDDTIPSMTIVPSDSSGGEWRVFEVETKNFDVDLGTELCCYDDTMMRPTEDLRVLTTSTARMAWAISFLAEGSFTIGLTNGSEQVNAEVSVAEYTVEEIEEGQPAASGALGGDYNYAGYLYEESTGDRMITFGLVETGTSFRPYINLLEDGLQSDSHNWDVVTDTSLYSHSIYFIEPGTWYLRVMEFGYGEDLSWTFDLNVVEETLIDLPAVAEVEPNDDYTASMALGILGNLSTIHVAGDLDSVSNNGSDWNGDYDYYPFQVESDTTMTVVLDWLDESDDYDAMVFDVTSSAPDYTSLTNSCGNYFVAREAFPEWGSVPVIAGRSYVAMVAGWDGNPGTYELTLAFGTPE